MGVGIYSYSSGRVLEKSRFWGMYAVSSGMEVSYYSRGG